MTFRERLRELNLECRRVGLFNHASLVHDISTWPELADLERLAEIGRQYENHECIARLSPVEPKENNA